MNTAPELPFPTVKSVPSKVCGCPLVGSLSVRTSSLETGLVVPMPTAPDVFQMPDDGKLVLAVKVCAPVQVLGLARFRDTVPDVVIGPPVRPVPVATLVTVPTPPTPPVGHD